MISVKDAFCLPGARFDRRRTGFGIYGPDGALLPHAAITTASWISQPDPVASLPAEVTRLIGPSLFAGSSDKQFGFVLLNALGRLWALDELPAQTTLVFAARPMARRVDHRMLALVLRGLGLAQPVVVAETPLWFETLHLAEERFGEARDGRGEAAFYNWIDSRWPAPAPPDPKQKLYVTRTGLGPQAGRYACEDHLERMLAQEGYEIFAPEAHPVAEQVRRFQAAGKLIFAESSALHLFALVRRPGQVSAVVQRRGDLPAIMAAQMADRPGQPTRAINAISELWWPPMRGEHLGLSVLDFARLRAALADMGLVSARSWPEPDRGDVAASLRAGLAEGQEIMDAEARAGWLAQHRKTRKR